MIISKVLSETDVRRPVSRAPIYLKRYFGDV